MIQIAAYQATGHPRACPYNLARNGSQVWWPQRLQPTGRGWLAGEGQTRENPSGHVGIICLISSTSDQNRPAPVFNRACPRPLRISFDLDIVGAYGKVKTGRRSQRTGKANLSTS
jgi:hypothetical protein